jgi:hypothetical protein
MTNTIKFDNLIAEFRVLKSLKDKCVLKNSSPFTNIVMEIKKSKDIIYKQRLDDLKRAVSNNNELFRISTFELMEHNFRENSHSNILQYLCDYNNLGQESVNVLKGFLSPINNDVSAFIIEKLGNKSYKVIREYPTEKGRIDILITDKQNKFNIIIENKLLAEISVKEINEKNEVTKTQLDDYYDYINGKFEGYQNLFLLLSYYSYDEEINNYFKINYETVYLSLKNIKTDDVILSEYKSLLTSLLTGVDKNMISLSIQKLKNDLPIELNTIEKLNKIISYETE